MEKPQPDAQAFEKELAGLREKIDGIDTKIVALINERLGVSAAVGDLKRRYDSKVLDRSRESLIMDRICRLNQGPVDDTVLQYIFSVIMAASRELQKPQTIAYLGPEATHSHLAALSHFRHSGRFAPYRNIAEIFAEVERGGCQYGVVPVENSIEGAVTHTLDLLFESDVQITAEHYQTISHDLLSLWGNLDEVEVVYSHPQPFAQCRSWLQRNLPDAVLEECSSTAQAARKAAANPKSAAIASTQAAQVYGLRVVESKIEDSSRNETRFLVLGREDQAPTGDDKTSVMFVTSHIPGALFTTLEPVADAGLNMVKLESRPTKRENWSYFFIMDIEGHREDARVKRVLSTMKGLCLYLKVLGSYAKGEHGGYRSADESPREV